MATNTNNPYYNQPPAYMGYVGFAKLTGLHQLTTGTIIRVNSANIALKQEVSKPGVIDSRMDPTVYQLGPQEVDGSIAFPAVYDKGRDSSYNIVAALYDQAVRRTPTGLLNDFDVEMKYATNNTFNQSNFLYKNCILNSWQFSVSNQDVVNISCDIMGLWREQNNGDFTPGVFNNDTTTSELNYKENTRIVTWADARVVIIPGAAGELGQRIGGQHIRSFEANINNNAERFYTMNTYLYAQAVAPTKRDVTGNVVLMGRHPALADVAWNNQTRPYESTRINFGFVPTVSTGSNDVTDGFGVSLPNVVFQIEEMELTNSLFETTINWHSLPAAGVGTDAGLGEDADPLLQGDSIDFNYEDE